MFDHKTFGNNMRRKTILQSFCKQIQRLSGECCSFAREGKVSWVNAILLDITQVDIKKIC